jgi:UDP-N-acetylmuramoyl-L-alanyl-D-glutamate--2,6-diaminopimelate ligase
MEASSHALAQQRFFGLPIHTAVWTHLTQDHLDYHGTMAGYAAEKRKLLRWPDLKYCVLNLGDATAREAYEQGDYSGQALTYQVCPPGLQPEETFTPHPEAAYVIPKVTCSADGLSMTLRTPEGEKPWQLPCWGYFNAENALAALLTLISFGWTIQEACEALVQVPLPTGRMEPLKRTGLATVIIDYAHTPDALKQVLLAARPHCQGRLWVVFGCGGDRDTTKRPLMGAAAQALADAVVLTDDNPRSEASHSIIEDIQSGMTLEGGADQCWVEPDRAKAIALALRSATGEDVIVVAGKGHETYQEIAGERFAFNDREVVGALFDELVVD